MQKKMDIIYEDKNLLVINKPTRLLTIGTDRNREQTLYREASAYVKKQYPRNKVFIVNRLDKDTSGIVMFAKNEELKQKLQDHWNEWANIREYVAVVEGKMQENKGTMKSYLTEDQRFLVHSTTNPKLGKLAITHYETLKYKNTYTLLKIKIDTGRKNQIRVQLSDMGNPIVGDKKYGAKRNPMGRLGLHCERLVIQIPGYKHRMEFICHVPKEFHQMFESEEIYGKNPENNS